MSYRNGSYRFIWNGTYSFILRLFQPFIEIKVDTDSVSDVAYRFFYRSLLPFCFKIGLVGIMDCQELQIFIGNFFNSVAPEIKKRQG